MDPSQYRPAPGTIPDSPGVYRFREPSGRVIYVGKARSLRQRLSNYFQDLSALHPRTMAMVTTASSVDWVVVGTEVEALQLEYTWIKEYDPRFNVRYRDDKSYPYLAVTVADDYPRVTVMRGAKRKGTRYFGPYAHAWAIRETVDVLLRVFPVRTCSNGVFRRAGQVGRPCLLGYIGKCSAPCVGRVSPDEHRAIVEDFCTFMGGRTAVFIRRIESEMLSASDELDFERAARLRDDLRALQRATEKQAVVLGDGTDADVIGWADDELEAAVQVFHVRDGRVRGQRGFVVEKVDDTQGSGLVDRFLQQLYGDEPPEAIPREILLPIAAEDEGNLRAWLTERRNGPVALKVPVRGDKKALLDTVSRNAVQSLALHKVRRAGDLTTRSLALAEIQEALDLREAPLRIECFDVSNLQGTDVVASMVVFEDGVPRKSEYRRFTIKAVEGQDDVRSIAEVVTRRFRRYLDERDDSDALEFSDDVGEERGKRFAYPPQLVLIDGGAPQVEAAASAMAELGVTDVAVAGLAKRLEEVWLPGEPDPLILARGSEGLYLLQRVRDEAHRFAITFHRQKRSKRMTASVLDGIPGVGPARQRALMGRFGSMAALRRASLDELAAVPGIGPALAAEIRAALDAENAPAVNVTTGEIVGP